MTWLLRNFVLALSGSDTSLNLAFGALFGWCIGFCPLISPIGPYPNPITLVLIAFIFVFKVNISLAIAAFITSKGLSFPLFDIQNQIGESALRSEALNGVWTSLYNTPYIALSGFNHPNIMGGILLGLLFGIFGFPVIIKITPYYREKILPKLEKFWIIKVLKGSKLYTTLT